MELNATITLAEGVMSDMNGTKTTNTVSNKVVLTLDNSDRAENDGASNENTDIDVGDLVSISEATFDYAGKKIPSWVKETKWYVQKVSKDYVVLGKNEQKTRHINLPVNSKDLTKVEDNSDGEEKSKETSEETFTISDEGLKLIMSFEGCRLKAYQLETGVWTIGYGHTGDVKPVDTITKDEAKELLREDLKLYEGYVYDMVKNGRIQFEMNQNQFDALVSFTYSTSKNTLSLLVTGRTAETVADKMLTYNKAGGKVLVSLDRRRKLERELFLKNVED